MIEYLFTAVLLFVIMLAYFKLASKFNIIDKPNERSSHSEITLRGGGIIFPVAFLFLIMYQIIFNDNRLFLVNYWTFGLGLFLICGISFIDDILDLSSKIRLIFHFISVSLLLYFINAFEILSIWAIPLLYILIIGILNAFNFMDGINGITGIYSLVILGSLFFMNEYIINFTDQNFIIFPILASVVFLFFNFRKRAKCFMGDVGSLGIAFWIIALLGMLIFKTSDIKYILFLAVYGIDVIITIVERLMLKENIFKPHRKHLYQLLANERSGDHLFISVIYGILQLLICVLVIKGNSLGNWIFPIILIPFFIFYLLLKIRIRKSIRT